MIDNMNPPHYFSPPWWLSNRHVQSCLSTIFPQRAQVDLVWEELNLPDGDFLDLCWTGPMDGPVVILLHGLEGSVNSHYIQLMLNVLSRMGWRVVVMHFRTCSGRLNRLARSYHAGDIEDITYLIEALSSRYPQQCFSIIGFSLGANVLLHYLSHTVSAPIRQAIAVSVPFELSTSVDYSPQFYQWKLLYTMKEKTLQKIKQGLDMPATVQEVAKIHDFRSFDNIVTAPLHGFCSAKEYYERTTIRPFLRGIEHATLIIHSWDDPLVSPSSVPAAAELPACVKLELYERGGHVGFVQGRAPWKLQYWLADRILSGLS